MTASAPAPSAVRRTAPRLPGFSTPSTTTMSGSSARHEVVEAELRRRHDRDDPVRALAEGDLGEDRRAHRRSSSAGAGGGRRPRGASGVRSRSSRDERRARPGRRRRGPGGSRGRRRRSSGRSGSRSRRSRRRTAALTRGFVRLVIGGLDHPRIMRAATPSGRTAPLVASTLDRPVRRRSVPGAGSNASTSASPRSSGRAPVAWAVRRTKASSARRRARRRRAGPAGRRRAPSGCRAARARSVGGSRTMPVIAAAATRLAAGRRRGRRRRSSGSGDRRARTARRCGVPTRRPAATRRRGSPARRPGASARVVAPVVGEEVEDARLRATRRAPARSHGQNARCSGNRPTWPASVGRSSGSSPSSAIVQGASRRPGPACSALEAEVGRGPCLGRQAGRPERRGCRAVDQALAEPVQPPAIADVEELVCRSVGVDRLHEVHHRARRTEPLREAYRPP